MHDYVAMVGGVSVMTKWATARLACMRALIPGLALAMLVGLSGCGEAGALSQAAGAMESLERAVVAGRWTEAQAAIPAVRAAFYSEVLDRLAGGDLGVRTASERALADLPDALRQRDLRRTLDGLGALRSALDAGRRRSR